MRVEWCQREPRLLHPVSQSVSDILTLFRRLDVASVAGCCLLPLSGGRWQSLMAAYHSSFSQAFSQFIAKVYENSANSEKELCSENDALFTVILSHFLLDNFGRFTLISKFLFSPSLEHLPRQLCTN